MVSWWILAVLGVFDATWAQPVLPGMTDLGPGGTIFIGDLPPDLPIPGAAEIRAFGEAGLYPFTPADSRECSTLPAVQVENRSEPRRSRLPFVAPPLASRFYHLPGDCIRRRIRVQNVAQTRDASLSVLLQDSVGRGNPDQVPYLFGRVVLPQAEWLRYIERIESRLGANGFGASATFRQGHGLSLDGMCQLLPSDVSHPLVRCSLELNLFVDARFAYATVKQSRSGLCTTRPLPEARDLNEVAQGLNQHIYSPHAMQAANSYLQRMGEDCVAPFLREAFSQADALLNTLETERRDPDSEYSRQVIAGRALGGATSPVQVRSHNHAPLGNMPLNWSWNAIAVEEILGR